MRKIWHFGARSYLDAVLSRLPGLILRSLRRSAPRLARIATFTVAITMIASFVQGSNPYLEIPAESVAKGSRAYAYANMSNQEALSELKRRGIPFQHATPPMPGVRAPIKLSAPLNGVWIHSALPAEKRKDSPFEILDARLALALDDFSKVLATHDIVEVVHFTMYRPSPNKATAGAKAQSRHPGGLAIDVGAMKKRSGHWMAVGPHWPSKIGAKTCGRSARSLVARTGRELISILCETADLRVFHYMLTPHFDRRHDDHWHLEIKPEVKWFLVN